MSGREPEWQRERTLCICVFSCFVCSILVVAVLALLVAACEFNFAQFCEINAKRAFYRIYVHVYARVCE